MIPGVEIADPVPEPRMPKGHRGIVAEKTSQLWGIVIVLGLAGSVATIILGAGKLTDSPPDWMDADISKVAIAAGSVGIGVGVLGSYKVIRGQSLEHVVRQQLLKKYKIVNGEVYLKQDHKNQTPLFNESILYTIIDTVVLWEKEKNFNQDSGGYIPLIEEREAIEEQSDAEMEQKEIADEEQKQKESAQHDFKGLLVSRRGKEYQVFHNVGTRLGEGSHAIGFRVFNIASGRFNFLKQAKGEAIDLLEREEATMQRAEVPFIGSFHLDDQEIPFHAIVMELAERDVDKIVNQESYEGAKLPDVIQFFDNIISQLAKLHKKNIAHLDIKALNILLFAKGNRYRLSDFGGSIHAPAPQPGETINLDETAVSPEFTSFFDLMLLLNGDFPKEHVQKIDIFQLGIMLNKWVTGYFPYQEAQEIEDQEFIKTLQTVSEDHFHYKKQVFEITQAAGGEEFFLTDEMIELYENYLQREIPKISAATKSDIANDFVMLIKDMTKKKPSERLNIQQVIARWETIKAKIKKAQKQ